MSEDSSKKNLPKSQLQDLIAKAKAVSQNAYCPYSRFPVGAAILGGSGNVYVGCNVENASYGLTNCAERTAVFSAIAAGEKRICIVVVFTPTDTPSPPCGACRQVIAEFGPNCQIVCVSKDGPLESFTLDQLLPGSFGPHNLKD